MESKTKSKITLNLYGDKVSCQLLDSDPELHELISGFVNLLQMKDFDLDDIHQALVFEVLNNSDYEDITPIYDPASTNATSEAFFDAVTKKKSKK